MQRVEYLNPQISALTPKESGKTEKKKKPAEKSLFFNTLTKESQIESSSIDATGEVGEEEIEQMIDSVYEKGEQMAQSQAMSDILEYKKAVKQFMSFVVKHSFEVDKVNSKKFSFKNIQQNNEKRYTIIKIVDSKLESLAASILSGQIDKIAILKKVNEIQGLLVDLKI